MLKLDELPPITGRDRARRLLWGIARVLLFRPTPPALHRWRSLLLQAFGARIRGRVFVYPTARIWAPWNLIMDDGSCLGPEVVCYNVETVHVGAGCTVSQRSHLCTASHDFENPDFPLTGAAIQLEEQAWVAAEVFVGPGVHVKRQAVLLARSVVVRDVPERAVVGGNPAKQIRYRDLFVEEVSR